jgi:hypothetical protein
MQLGVRRTVEVHENRTVLVSLTSRGTMRVHRGYAYASDRTLRAILTFLSTSTRRQARKMAEKEVVAFPVDRFVSTRRRQSRRQRPKPGDQRTLRELHRLHAQLNEMHFGGALKRIRFRISDRMRIRLGELTVDMNAGQAVEIAVSRRHIERDAWQEVEHTVLHEMIHQWQAESGHAIDHGSGFRNKAAEIGIEPHAHRVLDATG